MSQATNSVDALVMLVSKDCNILSLPLSDSFSLSLDSFLGTIQWGYDDGSRNRNISQKALNSDLPTLSSGIAKLLFLPMVPEDAGLHTQNPPPHINESVRVCILACRRL